MKKLPTSSAASALRLIVRSSVIAQPKDKISTAQYKNIRKKIIAHARLQCNIPFDGADFVDKRSPAFYDVSHFSGFVKIDHPYDANFDDMCSWIILNNPKEQLTTSIGDLLEELYSNNTNLSEYRRCKCFGQVLQWLFSFNSGHHIENLLDFVLKDDRAKDLFQKDFLSFQLEDPFNKNNFNYGKPIEPLEFPPLSIFFYIPNIAKLVRLIMQNYHPSLWDGMPNKEKFLFIKNVIYLTRSQGTYYYINSLFDFDKINNNKHLKNIFFSPLVPFIEKTKMNLFLNSNTETIKRTENHSFLNAKDFLFPKSKKVWDVSSINFWQKKKIKDRVLITLNIAGLAGLSFIQFKNCYFPNPTVHNSIYEPPMARTIIRNQPSETCIANKSVVDQPLNIATGMVTLKDRNTGNIIGSVPFHEFLALRPLAHCSSRFFNTSLVKSVPTKRVSVAPTSTQNITQLKNKSSWLNAKHHLLRTKMDNLLQAAASVLDSYGGSDVPLCPSSPKTFSLNFGSPVVSSLSSLKSNRFQPLTRWEQRLIAKAVNLPRNTANPNRPLVVVHTKFIASQNQNDSVIVSVYSKPENGFFKVRQDFKAVFKKITVKTDVIPKKTEFSYMALMYNNGFKEILLSDALMQVPELLDGNGMRDVGADILYTTSDCRGGSVNLLWEPDLNDSKAKQNDELAPIYKTKLEAFTNNLIVQNFTILQDLLNRKIPVASQGAIDPIIFDIAKKLELSINNPKVKTFVNHLKANTITVHETSKTITSLFEPAVSKRAGCHPNPERTGIIYWGSHKYSMVCHGDGSDNGTSGSDHPQANDMSLYNVTTLHQRDDRNLERCRIIAHKSCEATFKANNTAGQPLKRNLATAKIAIDLHYHNMRAMRWIQTEAFIKSLDIPLEVSSASAEAIKLTSDDRSLHQDSFLRLGFGETVLAHQAEITVQTLGCSPVFKDEKNCQVQMSTVLHPKQRNDIDTALNIYDTELSKLAKEAPNVSKATSLGNKQACLQAYKFGLVSGMNLHDIPQFVNTASHVALGNLDPSTIQGLNASQKLFLDDSYRWGLNGAMKRKFNSVYIGWCKDTLEAHEKGLIEELKDLNLNKTERDCLEHTKKYLKARFDKVDLGTKEYLANYERYVNDGKNLTDTKEAKEVIAAITSFAQNSPPRPLTLNQTQLFSLSYPLDNSAQSRANLYLATTPVNPYIYELMKEAEPLTRAGVEYRSLEGRLTTFPNNSSYP